MRIDGLPNPSTKSTQGNQRPESAQSKKPADSADDVVEISQGKHDVAALTEAVKSSHVRGSDRVAEVRSRVQSGYYDSSSIRREIAGALLRSDNIRQVADEAAMARVARERIDQLPDERVDRVSEARQHADEGHYDAREIRQQTAQRILDELA